MRTEGASIGLAGCGRMGLPMLEALHDAGLDVRGLDLRDVGSPLVTTDAAAFAEGLAVLITVVRDAAETEAVLFGDQALLARAPHLETLIVCSTLPPAFIAQLRERLPVHIRLVDAPMSGAQVAARERRLSFMLGGAAGDIAAIMPLLRAMGTSFHHMGPLGAGMAAKVLNNLVAAASVAATRTALDWAAAHGLDGAVLRALMNASSGQTWFSRHFEAIEFARHGHADDNSIGILVKDLACAASAAPPGADTRLLEALAEVLGRLTPYEGT